MIILESRLDVKDLAKHLNITHNAILCWKKIPEIHLDKISELYNIPKQQLRPELEELNNES